MGQLDEKVAVVTGASAGIGFAIAERFAAEGALVYMTGRRQQELDAAVAKVGHGAIGVRADVASAEDMDRLYATIGRNIDIVVANAGYGEAARLEDVTEEHYQKVFGTNVKGTVYTVQKALPLLNDNASIVLVSSIASTTGLAGTGIYSASKAAIRSFARTWANELKDRNIRVNALAPGTTDSAAMDAQLAKLGIVDPDAQREWIAQQTAGVPLKRASQPEEQAAAALFLASSQSSYVTGIELSVDGGVTQTGSWG